MFAAPHFAGLKVKPSEWAQSTIFCRIPGALDAPSNTTAKSSIYPKQEADVIFPLLTTGSRTRLNNRALSGQPSLTPLETFTGSQSVMPDSSVGCLVQSE